MSDLQALLPVQARPPTVLILQHQYIVGMDVADVFDTLGYEVLGPYCSCDHALDSLSAHQPDVAIVEFARNRPECERLLSRLAKRRIPFFVYTALDRSQLPAFAQPSWINMPAAPESLLSAANRAIEAHAA